MELKPTNIQTDENVSAESATQRLTGEIADMGVIFCPRNRQGGTRRRLRKILHLLQERGAAFDYVWSESPGSVERLASMMTRAGYKKIVVVGGDAALNHALCGIFSVNGGEGRLPKAKSAKHSSYTNCENKVRAGTTTGSLHSKRSRSAKGTSHTA